MKLGDRRNLIIGTVVIAVACSAALAYHFVAGSNDSESNIVGLTPRTGASADGDTEARVERSFQDYAVVTARNVFDPLVARPQETLAVPTDVPSPRSSDAKTITFAQDEREYTITMGEKDIPEAENGGSGSASSGAGGSGASEAGGPGGGPPPGRGGPGDMMRRLEENRSRMTAEQYDRARRYLQMRGSGGGGSYRGRSTSSYRGRSTSSSRGRGR